ncbi:MAG: hypothetical protein MUP97_01700 [Acidimicrobiia bacterium]|nr:hypothetical protein [Acidimicrobiia bacterium]
MEAIARLEQLVSDDAQALAELDVDALGHDEAVRMHRDADDLQRRLGDLRLRLERESG